MEYFSIDVGSIARAHIILLDVSIFVIAGNDDVHRWIKDIE